MSADSQGPQINSEKPNFTKEQLSHLYKLFQSPQFSNPSCSLAQQGNYLIAALSSIKSNVHCPWIIGATGAGADQTAVDHELRGARRLTPGETRYASRRTAIAGTRSISAS